MTEQAHRQGMADWFSIGSQASSLISKAITAPNKNMYAKTKPTVSAFLDTIKWVKISEYKIARQSGNLARYFDKWNCIWITFDVLLLVLCCKKKINNCARAAADAWNVLPEKLKQSDSLTILKNTKSALILIRI